MSRGRDSDLKQLMRAVKDTQTKLLTLTRDLAGLIRHPAHKWDATAMSACWENIEHYRPIIRKNVSQLNAAERAWRHTGAPAKGFARYRHARNRLKWQLKRWDRTADCVSLHINGPTRPMLLKRPLNESDLMLDRFHSYLHKLANPNAQSQDAEDHQCFADIPMPLQPFETMMQLAQRLMRAGDRCGDVRFLDVGCGGGTKMLAASQYFEHCDGLEYDASYAQSATKTLSILEPDLRVIHADALTYEGYADYDVIYFYRPIRDQILLHQMEDRICAMVKPGTLILAPYNAAIEPHSKWSIPNLIGPIFAPGLSEADARQWADNALRSDAVSLADQKPTHSDGGIWAPIIEATRYRW